ncbi:putative monooxygenase [Dothidotthia symphoricarpi CBS 119687]|uniref:Putative monooxygenase n=1 Tax=Dothidotthia symphoricarpi CBS 119687 TaxID=1392245 RepID=A0A6A6AQ41_9PLEO|nr:putative monooxygenase [Dothidotthia symphoricarpi CBS 119687]KAF2133656.1 putative monooxygenase [Dothidotthia symphoricarpi CBS 119687]
MVPHAVTINAPGDNHEFDAENWTSTSSQNPDEFALPERHPNTGVNVLVVGAGMGGLMTTLECWRKGHNIVGILERNDGPVYSGDIIVMLPSAVSVIRHWPAMQRDMETEQVSASVSYEKHSGEHIYGPTVPSYNDPEHIASRRGKGPSVAPAQIRSKFYRMLLRQVAKLGFTIEYGKTVRDYFENEAAGTGGVVLQNGDVRMADVVVAADGLKSRSEMLISGKHTPTKSSGMSIYRTAYPKEIAMRDPTVEKRWGNRSPVWEYWLGPGMYIGVFVSEDIVSWGFTPLDAQGGATESWEPDADPESIVKELLKVPDWDPAILALVRTAPKGGVVHWPLLWRDLRRDWTSKGGHIVQVGDSAHSFIPTSGNGATQALEDAVTLATCLQLTGRRSSATGTKIYNLLRYERVSCAQKMSFVNAQLKTETDWDTIWKDPLKVRTRFPKWIFSHDPEAYAYEKYGEAIAHLVDGAKFENTNLPPGHKFLPWTVAEVEEAMKTGRRVEDLLDGDWS